MGSSGAVAKLGLPLGYVLIIYNYSPGFCKGKIDVLNGDVTGTTTPASFVGDYNRCHFTWDEVLLLI